MKSKSIKLLSCILLSVLFISGCTSSASIKVGFVGTLSGVTSKTGIDGRRGVEMVIDHVNQSGGVDGRMLELVVKDSLNDVEIAKKIANEFIEKGINVVIGDYTSELTKSALEVIAGKPILYCSPMASADYFNEKDDNLLKLSGKAEDMVKAIIRQIQTNEDHNLLIIKDENNISYVNSISEVFMSLMKNGGEHALGEIYFDGKGVIDEIALISEIRDDFAQADGILLLADAPNTVSLARILRESGSELSLYTSGWSNKPELTILGGQFVEGMYTVSAIDEANTNSRYVEFAEKYVEYYGEIPSDPAVYSYNTLMAIYQGMVDSNSSDSDDVKKAIIDSGRIKGLQIDFSIDEYGDSTREYMQFIIRDGELVRMD